MITAFYTAKTGTKNYQSYLDAVANNVANVNTLGFKAQNVSFTDLLYADFQGANGTMLQNGTGSRILVSRDMSQGGAEQSDNPSDIVIKGNGFFAVQDAAGNIAYTRTGDFSVAEIGGANYLVAKNGEFVLDAGLNKIEVDAGKPMSLVSPGEAAQLSQADLSGRTVIGVFSFSDPEKLTAAGDGKYVVAANSGLTPALDTVSDLVAGMKESSNVNLVSEMARMITAQRGFQINANMIQTADEMEQYANNLGN